MAMDGEKLTTGGKKDACTESEFIILAFGYLGVNGRVILQ